MDTHSSPQGFDLGPKTIEGVGFSLNLSGTYVWLEDQLVPDRIEVQFVGNDGQPDQSARVEVIDGQPMVTDVRITAGPRSRGIRQSDLRALEVDSIFSLLAGFAMQIDESNADEVRVKVGYPDALTTIMKARSKGRVITPELLSRVAEVYRDNLNTAPTLAVKRHFMVGSRQASEYVQRARQAGLLPATTPGRKKG